MEPVHLYKFIKVSFSNIIINGSTATQPREYNWGATWKKK
jgi:hypothetical protein